MGYHIRELFEFGILGFEFLNQIFALLFNTFLDIDILHGAVDANQAVLLRVPDWMGINPHPADFTVFANRAKFRYDSLVVSQRIHIQGSLRSILRMNSRYPAAAGIKFIGRIAGDLLEGAP